MKIWILKESNTLTLNLSTKNVSNISFFYVVNQVDAALKLQHPTSKPICALLFARIVYRGVRGIFYPYEKCYLRALKSRIFIIFCHGVKVETIFYRMTCRFNCVDLKSRSYVTFYLRRQLFFEAESGEEK